MAALATAPTQSRDKRSSAAELSESDDERDSDFDGANVDNDQDDDELEGDFDGAIDDDEDLELDDEFDGADVDNDQDDDDEEDTSVDKGDSLADPKADDTEADLAAMLSARLGTSDDDEEDDEETEAKNTKRSSVPSRQSVEEENDDFTVQPRQRAEWVCATCFLIVNKAAAAASSCPHCGADRAAFATA